MVYGIVKLIEYFTHKPSEEEICKKYFISVETFSEINRMYGNNFPIELLESTFNTFVEEKMRTFNTSSFSNAELCKMWVNDTCVQKFISDLKSGDLLY